MKTSNPTFRAGLITLAIATSVFLPSVHSADEEHRHVRKPLPSQEEIDKLPEDGGEEFNRLIFSQSGEKNIPSRSTTTPGQSVKNFIKLSSCSE